MGQGPVHWRGGVRLSSAQGKTMGSLYVDDVGVYYTPAGGAASTGGLLGALKGLLNAVTRRSSPRGEALLKELDEMTLEEDMAGGMSLEARYSADPRGWRVLHRQVESVAREGSGVRLVSTLGEVLLDPIARADVLFEALQQRAAGAS